MQTRHNQHDDATPPATKTTTMTYNDGEKEKTIRNTKRIYANYAGELTMKYRIAKIGKVARTPPR